MYMVKIWEFRTLQHVAEALCHWKDKKATKKCFQMQTQNCQQTINCYCQCKQHMGLNIVDINQT